MSKLRICLFVYLSLTAYAYSADSSNRSYLQALQDNFTGEVTCSECSGYLQTACKHVNDIIKDSCNSVKRSLDENKLHVLYQKPVFSHGLHKARFEQTKDVNDKIPLCSNCIKILPDYEGHDDYPLMLTKLKNAIGSSGGSMSSTTHQGHNFGCVNAGMTPVWQDLFTTVKQDLKGRLNFLEIGSGFNLKPMALWQMGEGRINCTVNDINSDNCIDFIKSYFLINPRELTKTSHESFITLHVGDFLQGTLRQGQKYDVVMITNVLHYFTKEQVTTAMKELHHVTNKGGLVYLQAFSGSDEHEKINSFLMSMLEPKTHDEPLYLSNGHQQINVYTMQLINLYEGDQLRQKLAGSEKLPDIVHRSKNPFAFFPLASLKKLALEHGFEVVTGGLFDITSPSAGTSGPSKTPYFSWVKLKKL